MSMQYLCEGMKNMMKMKWKKWKGMVISKAPLWLFLLQSELAIFFRSINFTWKNGKQTKTVTIQTWIVDKFSWKWGETLSLQGEQLRMVVSDKI